MANKLDINTAITYRYILHNIQGCGEIIGAPGVVILH